MKSHDAQQKDWGPKREGLAIVILLALIASLSLFTMPFALAANNPGHDTLYVLKIGDNVTGPLNLTGSLTALGLQTATIMYGSGLDIWANNTLQASPVKPTIQAAGNDIIFDAPSGNIRFNTLAGTSNYIKFGTGSINVIVNGTLYQGTSKVCLANGTNCVGGNNTGNISSISQGNGITVTNPGGPTVTVATNAATCSAGQFSYWTGGAWQCGTPAGAGNVSGAGSANYVPLWTGASTVGNSAIYQSGGNVGIGTTAPTHLLHVNGSADVTIRISGDAGDMYLQSLSTVNMTRVVLSTTAQSGRQYQLRSNPDGTLSIFDNPSGQNFVWFNGSNHNVGIGTPSPTQALDVNGSVNVSGTNANVWIGTGRACTENNGLCGANGANTSGTGTQNYLPKWTSTSALGNSILYDDGTNIGIGTVTTTQKLTVAGGANFSGTVYASNVSSNSPLQLQTQGTTRIYVNDTNGNVGINKTNPASALDVAGTVTGTSFTGAGTGLTGTASSLTAGAIVSQGALATLGAVSGGTGGTITDNTITAADLASGDFSSKITSGTYSIGISGNAATASGLAAGTYNYGSGGTIVNANNANYATNSGQLNGQAASYYYAASNPAGFANSTNGIGINGNAATATTASTANAVSFNGGLTTTSSPTFAAVTATTFNGALNGNANTVTNGVYTTSALRWPLTTWMYSSGAGTRNWYIGAADMYWELGGAGSFHFRNSADTDIATISNTGAITGTSFTGAGTGLTGTATSLNIGGNAATATTATNVAWSGVTGQPSYLFYYQGFTLDANAMGPNAAGFTYSVNAPYTGPIASFSEGGYPLQINAPYGGGGGGLAFRTRNGDTSTWNPWYTVLHSGNYNSYAPTLTGTGASGTWGISVSGSAASLSASQSNYLVTSGNGNGLCFWSDCTNYKEHMGTGTEYQYGPVTDYSIKTTMSNNTGRGWTWGTPGATPVAAIEATTGNAQFAGLLKVGSGTPSNVSGAGNLYVTNSIEYDGVLYGPGADVAERTPTSEQGLAPGMVLALDPSQPGKVQRSSSAYSTLVAGVYSTDPAAVFGKDSGGVPLAIAGRVPVKVNAENGPIAVGDYLVSSSTPGEAMGCRAKELAMGMNETVWRETTMENERCRNAAFAKAMTPLDGKEGTITGLVVLN